MLNVLECLYPPLFQAKNLTFRCYVLFFPWKLNTPGLVYASKIIPIFAWIFGFLIFIRSLFPQFGQYGVECKSMICRWISIDDKGYPTDYNPEYGGTMVLIGLMGLLLALNLASYIKIRVTRYINLHKYII